jgi:hypothetical protein
MMKIRLIVAVTIAVLFNCKCSSTLEPPINISVQQKDATLDQVFTIGSGDYLFGIDSTTGLLKVKMKFNSKEVFAYGGKSEDGRVFFSDGGQLGTTGDRIIVLDKNCNKIKEISCFPLPSIPIVAHDKLFVNNAGVTPQYTSGLQIFDLNNYKNVFETKNIQGWFLLCFNDSFAYAAMNAAGSSPVTPRNNFIMRYNLNTLDTATQTQIVLPLRDSLERIEPLLDGNSLVCLLYTNHIIAKYDIQTGNELALQAFNPSDLIPHNFITASTPTINKDGTYSCILSSGYGAQMVQKILTFNSQDLSIKSHVDLDTSYRIDPNTVKFCNTFVISSYSGYGATVFDRTTGSMVAHYAE